MFDPFNEFCGRLVGGILADELAGEGAGEEGRRELGHLSARLGHRPGRILQSHALRGSAQPLPASSKCQIRLLGSF